MNNKYAYRENDILVHTDTEMVSRQYVDNIDNILISENKIETLEKHIKMFKNSLDLNSANRKQGKTIFNTLVAVGIAVSLASFCIGIGSLLIADAIKVSLLFLALPVSAGTLARLALCSNGATKKNVEKLKNRILLYNYELDKERKQLNKLEQSSKEIEIPKEEKIMNVSTICNVENLKIKLTLIELFKQDPEMYINAYNNGFLAEVLKECFPSENTDENLLLVRFLICEYRKQQWSEEKENSKNYFKSRR